MESSKCPLHSCHRNLPAARVHKELRGAQGSWASAWPSEGRDDDESDHVICIDSKDADDAAQVIGRLIESLTKQRQNASGAEQHPTQCDLELWQEIAPVRADFNSREIEEEERHGRKESPMDRAPRDGFLAKPWKHF